MATARDKVIQYLHDAREAEYAFATLLATNIAAAPDGDHRRRLEHQRNRSREREYRLSDRLGELAARRSLQNLGLDAAKATIALATAPWQLLGGPSGEDRLLKNARDLCAAAAMLAADYRALEQIAGAGRDEITAKLAVELRAESDDALSECLAAVERLAEAVVTGGVEGDPVHPAGRIGAVQMLRLPKLRESLYRLRDEVADMLPVARRGVMRLEARTIIPDYDSLSVEQIRDRIVRLSQAELATVEAYERVTRNRAGVLEAIRELHGREPWPGYDEMGVEEIRSRMRDADQERIRAVLDYERDHKNRPSVLNAAEADVVATQPA